MKIRIWSIAALIALFAFGSIYAQSETTAKKQATSSTKPITKKKTKKKTKKTVHPKTKTSTKKSTATSSKSTSPTTSTTPPSQPVPPVSKPEPKPAAVATIEQSTRIAGGLTLYGTSTLHSWTMSSTAVQGSASISTLEGELEKLSGVTFIVPVRTLKGESSSLNDNAYEALKESKNKDIRFALSSARVRRESAGHYAIDVSGNLSIAGVTKPISSVVTAVKNGNSFTCSGTQTVRMSDYGVERPSFMLGAMKAGDEVTIKYNVALQP